MDLSDVLIAQLSSAIKAVQIHQVLLDDTEGFENGSEKSVNTLLLSLDKIFLYGLHNKQHGYWNVVHPYCKRDMVQMLSSLRNVNTDLGRGRAWLYVALNEKLLESFLINIQHDTQQMNMFYNSFAIVKSHKIQLFVDLLCGLEFINFSLDMDQHFLDISVVPTNTSTPPRLPYIAPTLSESSNPRVEAGSSVYINTDPIANLAKVGTQKAANALQGLLQSSSRKIFNRRTETGIVLDTIYDYSTCIPTTRPPTECLLTADEHIQHNPTLLEPLIPPIDCPTTLSSSLNISSAQIDIPSFSVQSNSGVNIAILKDNHRERHNPFGSVSEEQIAEEIKLNYAPSSATRHNLDVLVTDNPIEVVHQRKRKKSEKHKKHKTKSQSTQCDEIKLNREFCAETDSGLMSDCEDEHCSLYSASPGMSTSFNDEPIFASSSNRSMQECALVKGTCSTQETSTCKCIETDFPQQNTLFTTNILEQYAIVKTTATSVLHDTSESRLVSADLKPQIASNNSPDYNDSIIPSMISVHKGTVDLHSNIVTPSTMAKSSSCFSVVDQQKSCHNSAITHTLNALFEETLILEQSSSLAANMHRPSKNSTDLPSEPNLMLARNGFSINSSASITSLSSPVDSSKNNFQQAVPTSPVLPDNDTMFDHELLCKNILNEIIETVHLKLSISGSDNKSKVQYCEDTIQYQVSTDLSIYSSNSLDESESTFFSKTKTDNSMCQNNVCVQSPDNGDVASEISLCQNNDVTKECRASNLCEEDAITSQCSYVANSANSPDLNEIANEHACVVTIDNNIKLKLMLDVFQSEDEQLLKMIRFKAANQQQLVGSLHVAFTDQFVYIVEEDSTLFLRRIHFPCNEVSMEFMYDKQGVFITCLTTGKCLFNCETSDSSVSQIIHSQFMEYHVTNAIPVAQQTTDIGFEKHLAAIRKCISLESGKQNCVIDLYRLINLSNLRQSNIYGRREGILLRKSARSLFFRDHWKSFNFVLDRFTLSQFKNRNASKPDQSWQLSSILHCQISMDDPCCFELLMNDGKTVELKALSAQACTEWIAAVQAIIENPNADSSGSNVSCSVVVAETQLFFLEEEFASMFCRCLSRLPIGEIDSVRPPEEDGCGCVVKARCAECRREEQSSSFFGANCSCANLLLQFRTPEQRLEFELLVRAVVPNQGGMPH